MTVGWVLGLGVAYALGWISRWRWLMPVRERVIDVPRIVDVPQPLGICTVCSETLRPGPPHQLYLELTDCHGRQRAKWAVGRGERQVQAIQASDAVGVARVNREVWHAVVRCNGIDMREGA